MEKYIGRIWILLASLVVLIIVWLQGDNLGALETRTTPNPFLIALTQLGILYIVALFVERALEVLVKAWRQGGKVRLEQQRRTAFDSNSDANAAEEALGAYRAGTQRRALLLGLTLGLMVSLSGIRLLAPIFQLDATDNPAFQLAAFNFTDIVITAGLIAGGSSTIHELMALIEDFLKASRNGTKQS